MVAKLIKLNYQFPRMKKSFCLILLSVAALAVSSCNTFIGAGRDIQSVGAGMQNKAEGRNWDGQTHAPAPAARPPARY